MERTGQTPLVQEGNARCGRFVVALSAGSVRCEGVRRGVRETVLIEALIAGPGVEAFDVSVLDRDLGLSAFWDSLHHNRRAIR